MLDRVTAEDTFALRELVQRIEIEHNAVATAISTRWLTRLPPVSY
jgi:hypothetical protein